MSGVAPSPADTRSSVPPREDLALALSLHARGEHAAAAAAYERAVRHAPRDARLRCNLSSVYTALQRPRSAVTQAAAGLRLEPGNTALGTNLGLALKSGRHLRWAERALRDVAARAPSAAAHLNLGNVLKARGDLRGALGAFEEGVALAPGDAAIVNAYGASLHDAGLLEEARGALERAAVLAPAWHLPWLNLGEVLLREGRHDAAIASFRRSLACDGSCWQAHADLSMALLQTGRFEEGWREYEWRWGRAGLGVAPPGVDVPQWRGGPVGGRVLLLWAEQGLGDALQFVRYATLAAAAGATVWLRVPRALGRLCASCEGVARVVTDDEPVPAGIQLHASLMSLPHVFGTTLETVPARVPYLSPPELRGEPLAADGRRRVGIAWSGSAAYAWNTERSFHARDMAPLALVPGVRLYSLQYGPPARELGSVPELAGTLDLSHRLGDLADTAALVARLDLVVTVDTSLAHLAGALGRPTAVALAHSADWRWLLARDDSPWYPSLRLYRQPRPGDWTSVFRRIASDLASS
jgi:Tfp pilus assembly protein PilF